MNDFDLRRQLQGLQAPRSPGRDLWPDIAARIDGVPRQMAPRRHWHTLALAASLVLAVAFAGALWLRAPADHADTVVGTPAGTAPTPMPMRGSADAAPRTPRNDALLVQADALTLEYVTALEQIGGAGLPHAAATGVTPALADLDRSADAIRSALRDAPRAEFLLAQLRRTYAQRLRLTQEALAS